MKIIHCADIHLGSSLTTNYEADMAKKRQAELFATFTRMLDYADSHNVPYVIIAGDLFDKDNGIKTLKENVLKAIGNHPAVSVYYLKGNHDNNAETEGKPDNLHEFGDDWSSYAIGEKKNVVITGVELNKGNMNIVYNTLNLAPEVFNIVVMHGQQSQYDSKNDAEVINLKALQNKNIDYLALGHIHSYSEKELDNRGVYCYPGCLEPRGFDEIGQHGFMLLDIDESSLNYTHEFVPFATREIFYEDIDVSECGTSYEIAELLKARLNKLGCHGNDIVEFVLVGYIPVDCEIDETFITNQIGDMVHYLKLKDRTSVKIDYSQYEMDESLKGEFVRIVFSDGSMTDDEKRKIIKTGIDALAGREI